jgi:lipoprotein-releasing system ATP-binding protein
MSEGASAEGPLIVARGLGKSYPSGARRLDVLRQLDMVVAPGESVAIVGESGVGKSTLLHLLGGLDRPDEGELRFRGRALGESTPAELAEYRNASVGFVFQFHYLLPEFTALENVEMPSRIARHHDQAARAGARRLLERLGLEARMHHRSGALSGGEQQRVAIARALVMRPELVLADEPTGNLDPATGERVFRLLSELQQDRGFALVLATHNERLARGCHRILRLAGGALRALDERGALAYFDSPPSGPPPVA